MHSDAGRASPFECKKAIMMGASLTSSECERRMKAWLLAGLEVDPSDPSGRAKHVQMDARKMDL
eukprot:20714-Alexandrium_andersonii.AAC.1